MDAGAKLCRTEVKTVTNFGQAQIDIINIFFFFFIYTIFYRSQQYSKFPNELLNSCWHSQGNCLKTGCGELFHELTIENVSDTSTTTDCKTDILNQMTGLKVSS